MNLLSAAERLGEIDRSAVRYEPGRCLHSLNKFSECEACLQLCPVGAIQPGKAPEFQAEQCVRCYACLPACPTGAYAADDSVPALLTCAARVESGQVEVVCSQHPQPQSGLSDNAVAIQVRGCLAGLGAGAYMALVCTGVKHAALRLDACADCAWARQPSQLRALIEDQIATARRVLQAWGLQDTVEAVAQAPEPLAGQRPLWEADNPPLTRRDLFKLASRQGQIAAARAMGSQPSADGAKPGRERSRMIHAARRIAAEHTPSSLVELEGMGFAALSVSEACIACGVCGRACPTGTLHFSRDGEKTYSLSFYQGACIDCGICAQVCSPGAIRIDHRASVSNLAQAEPILLQEGGLTHCKRCNALIAARPGVRLCPLCQFRRDNPFASRLPPGIVQGSSPEKRGQPS